MNKLLVLFFLILFGCAMDEQKTAEIKSTYSKKNDRIPMLKLPFKISCGADTMKITKIAVESSLFKTITDNLYLGGCIKSTENFKALILVNPNTDYQLHYLSTINKKGELIDQISLFNINCSGDQFYYGFAEYEISRDFIITLKDSTAKYKRNEKGEIDTESINSKSHLVKYKIDSIGRINIIRN